MKKQSIILTSTILLGLIVFACVRDWINPYDTDCPPEIWAPKNLTVQKANGRGILVKWQQSEKHFDGFTLDRSADSSAWKSVSSDLIEKGARQFTDTIHQPGQPFFYRIVAVADKNKSSFAYSPRFEYPTELPTVVTSGTNIDEQSVTFYGVLIADGGVEITEKGFFFGENKNEEQAWKKVVSEGSDTDFCASVDSLIPGKKYFLKAFATNENGSGFGNVDSFMIDAVLPTVVLDSVSVISATEAGFFAKITDDGGAADGVTEKGFCFVEDLNIPEISSNKTPAFSETNEFTASVDGLEPGQTYTVRAYSKNIAGVSFSDTASFVMPAVKAEVVLKSIENVEQYSVELTGEVTDEGGSAVTENGFCWSQDSNPEINDNFKKSEAGVGIFKEDIQNLAPNTKYFFRAYAINEIDTAYSNEITATTLPDTAVVFTKATEFITSTSAVFNGRLIDDGGSQIKEVGFCYLTEMDVDLEQEKSPMPDFSNNVEKGGSIDGEGNYTKQMNNLQPGIEYFVRSYAINEADTSLGNTVSFITECNDCDFNTMADPSGKIYKTVTLGDQVWMAENLAYLPTYVNEFSDSSRVEARYYVYQYDGINVEEAKAHENFEKFGVLYNWVAANQLSTLIGNGWRLPTDEDWKKLEAHTGMSPLEIEKTGFRGANEGTKIKFCRDFLDPIERGTDEFCFGAKAAGIRGTIDWGAIDLPFGIGVGTAWWSSTINNAQSGDYGYLRAVTTSSPKIFRIDGELDFGFSVRLVKDKQ